MNAASAPTVAELVQSRTTARTSAAKGRRGRPDGLKLGLAVEGGGMRGIVTGGMLLALRDLGLLPAFDAFYGTSSGSMNIAYTVGGANWDGLTVYYEHLTHGFVRREQRWKVTRPVLDMAYAFDEVMTTTVPIGWDAVVSSSAPVYAALTNVDRVETELLDMRALGTDRMTYLKAGAWIPWLAGPPPVIDGTRYIDGGLLCPDPVYAALDDGCTHVLVLNSSPRGRWAAVPRSRPVLRSALNRWQSGLGDAYVKSRARWDHDRARAVFEDDAMVDDAVVRRITASADGHRVGQLTHRRGVLLDGARAGYGAIAEVFGGGKKSYFSLTMI